MFKKIIKYISSIFFILSFLAILSPVYADSGSVASVSAGYGYIQYLDDDITTRTFNTFITSNLEQDLNTLPNKTTVYIDEFDLRITVPNKFQANYKYTITFTWAGYKPSTVPSDPFANGKSFYELFQYFENIGRCRVSNWNSTNLEADSCFKNYSMSYVLVPNSYDDSTVEVTITFTPKVTFYGFTTYFNYGNLLANPYLPLNAWSIQSVEYSTNYISSSGGDSGSTGGVTSNDINNIINNQTQNTQNIIDNQTQNTQDIINSITDTTVPELGSLADAAGWLPPGPVDSVLNLPLSFLNNLSDNLGGSCQPVTLTLPYVNKNIELPCVSTLYDKIGLTPFLNWTSPIVCCFILFGYLINLYKWVDDTLTLRENTYIDNWGGV